MQHKRVRKNITLQKWSCVGFMGFSCSFEHLKNLEMRSEEHLFTQADILFPPPLAVP